MSAIVQAPPVVPPVYPECSSDSKLIHRQQGFPASLPRVDIMPEHILQSPAHALSLAVTLRMI